ncbi:helix-turn-helix domain-containing protein [Thermomonospora cellulosilytica]|uniref:helix-turn-helix domain-containing protein n=1 Tax=Thermomonospora cellulosilytica TaxID=1411118 RepID=UPI0015FBE5E6
MHNRQHSEPLASSIAPTPAVIECAQPVHPAISAAGAPTEHDLSGLLTPEQVADLLQVKVSWLKEKARRREIPHVLIGGAYRFAYSHVPEIVHLFERRPDGHAGDRPATRRRTSTPSGDGAVATLRARRPQRRRSA